MKEEYFNSILLSYSFSDIKIKEHKTNCGSYYSFEAKRNNHEIHFVYSGSAKTLVKKILSYSEMSFSGKEDKMNYNDLKEELEEFIQERKQRSDRLHALLLSSLVLCLNFTFAIAGYLYFEYGKPLFESSFWDFIISISCLLIFIFHSCWLLLAVINMGKR